MKYTNEHHVMIDIETLASRHKQPMIQFAAVYFCPILGDILEEFEICIDANELIESNEFDVDMDTLKWWLKQDTSILSKILENGEPPLRALEKIREFLGKATHIWSHSTFDFTVLQNHFWVYKVKLLNYKSAMDIRTLVELASLDLNKYNWNEKTHHALDDCKFQIKYVIDALRAIDYQGLKIAEKKQLDMGKNLVNTI